MAKTWVAVKPWIRETSQSITHASNLDVIKEIPSNNLILRLTQRQVFVNNLASVGLITFQFKINQVPVPFYNAIKDINANPVPMMGDIEINPTNEIEVNIANADGAIDYIAGLILWGELGYWK